MAEQLDPASMAEKLLSTLKRGKETHDIFAINFRTKYSIAGKTIEEWERHFKISVPADPDPAVCKSLDMTIMALHQEAAFLYAEASAYVQALQKGNDTQYRTRYARLVAEYKEKGGKLPSANTLENLVRSETDDIEGALMAAELQKGFWSNMMDHLNMCRRLLENATINSGIQAKLDIGKGNLHDTPNRSSSKDSWL